MNIAKTTMFCFSMTVLISGCKETVKAPEKLPADNVKISGTMKQVMRDGKLQGTIALDSITPREHLYGVGPVEFLQGELLILNGESYVSKVATDSTMTLAKTFDVKAPFFVYGHVRDWEVESLPAHVTNLEKLEAYLDEKLKTRDAPVIFKIQTTVTKATIHVVNLPEGTAVSSPEEAHQGMTYYPLKNEEVEILGFFSRKHQAVFTHHDTYVHLHLITKNKQMMGHLDEVEFSAGSSKLFISHD